jgi:hypothetical protein
VVNQELFIMARRKEWGWIHCQLEVFFDEWWD